MLMTVNVSWCYASAQSKRSSDYLYAIKHFVPEIDLQKIFTLTGKP